MQLQRDWSDKVRSTVSARTTESEDKIALLIVKNGDKDISHQCQLKCTTHCGDNRLPMQAETEEHGCTHCNQSCQQAESDMSRIVREIEAYS